MEYPLSFREEYGDIVVRSRNFPELLTFGNDLADAMANAADALDVVMLSYIEKGKAIPLPSPQLDDEHMIAVSDLMMARLEARTAPKPKPDGYIVTSRHGMTICWMSEEDALAEAKKDGTVVTPLFKGEPLKS